MVARHLGPGKLGEGRRTEQCRSTGLTRTLLSVIVAGHQVKSKKEPGKAYEQPDGEMDSGKRCKIKEVWKMLIMTGADPHDSSTRSNGELRSKQNTGRTWFNFNQAPLERILGANGDTGRHEQQAPARCLSKSTTELAAIQGS